MKGQWIFSIGFTLLIATVLILGTGQGSALAGQAQQKVDVNQGPNLLEKAQNEAAATRAAQGMMRGVTNSQRWEAAKRHADNRAEKERGKKAQGKKGNKKGQTPGVQGGGQ